MSSSASKNNEPSPVLSSSRADPMADGSDAVPTLTASDTVLFPCPSGSGSGTLPVLSPSRAASMIPSSITFPSPTLASFAAINASIAVCSPASTIYNTVQQQPVGSPRRPRIPAITPSLNQSDKEHGRKVSDALNEIDISSIISPGCIYCCSQIMRKLFGARHRARWNRAAVSRLVEKFKSFTLKSVDSLPTTSGASYVIPTSWTILRASKSTVLDPALSTAERPFTPNHLAQKLSLVPADQLSTRGS